MQNQHNESHGHVGTEKACLPSTLSDVKYSTNHKPPRNQYHPEIRKSQISVGQCSQSTCTEQKIEPLITAVFLNGPGSYGTKHNQLYVQL
jgi:hypothetical protein